VLALALIKAFTVMVALGRPAAATAERRGIAAAAGGAVVAGSTCLVI
jgi:hypothetical protein